ncbi:MAG: YkgJ family cysteine cluster protein [Candidatus Sifarchaeia archaeon]
MISIDCARFCADGRVCCTETEMTVTREDVKRINALGYAKQDYLIKGPAGFCELKNIDGFCFFYDSDYMTCRIYDERPDGCRWYPVIYDAKKRKCMADTECPAAATVTRDRIRKVNHRVRALVETLKQEAAHGESPC